jgi:hypothetical protein
LFGRNLSLLGECLSILYISKKGCSEGTYYFWESA